MGYSSLAIQLLSAFMLLVPGQQSCMVIISLQQHVSDFVGKELQDARVLTDVGDVPIQEIRDCGVDDDRLMNVISDSVKLVMDEVDCQFMSFCCEHCQNIWS